MNKKRILIIVGTRPNFIKITQFKKLAVEHPFLELHIVHTGQHYDKKMADIFFDQFDLKPDHFLNIPTASANIQMAEIMLRMEEFIANKFKPELIIVVGDVNSTIAAALFANKTGIKLAHLESGLRSNDRNMPEEINRILTDELTDYFFVTEQSGYDNLIKEGKDQNKIHFVGNTMIDTLVGFEQKIEHSEIIKKLNLKNKKFVLMTMHRPGTVDNFDELSKLVDLIDYISLNYSIVFPIHPRTYAKLKDFGLLVRVEKNSNLIFIEPLDYFSFQHLIKYSSFILTDSGGIQEESTFLGIPCLTLRPNTERPSTTKIGTNTLVPFDMEVIEKYIDEIEKGTYKKGKIPHLWDGKATQRILNVIDVLLK